jgi:hypothetical protein
MSSYHLTKTGYKTYSNKNIVESNMSMHQQLTGTATPQSGTVNTNFKVVLDFSPADNYLINELYIDMTLTNSNATPVTVTLYNQWMIFSSIKCKLNGVEIANHCDNEQIFSIIAHNLEKYVKSDEELLSALNLFTYGATGHAGITVVGSGGIAYLSYPMLQFMFPELIGLNASLLTKIELEFTFTNNLGSAGLNCRFALSSTTANIWNSTDLAFGSIGYRLSIERFQNAKL